MQSEHGGRAQSETSGSQPATVIIVGHRGEPEKPGRDWAQLASSAPAVLGFIGIVVYGVARVSHDAFYSRFGVTAEEVGLTQSTILGTAALYFVPFALGITVFLAISWVLESLLEPPPSRRAGAQESAERWHRIDLALTIAVCAGIAAAILGLQISRPLAATIAAIVPFAVVIWRLGRRKSNRTPPVTILFGGLVLWAGAVAVGVASSGTASDPGIESFSWIWGDALVYLCVLALLAVSGLLARLLDATSYSRGADSKGKRMPSYLSTLPLLACVPLVSAAISPEFARFISDADGRLAVAVVMWAALFGAVSLAISVIWARQRGERGGPREAASIISAGVVIAASTLYLASERGAEIADQVLSGYRLSSQPGALSIKAEMACLESVGSSESSARGLPRLPVVYLGQSPGNSLILFDLERFETVRAREEIEQVPIAAPTRVPLRIPAAGVSVRVANLVAPAARYAVPVTVGDVRLPGKWDCFNSPSSPRVGR